MTATDDLAPFLDILAARIRRQMEARREDDRVAIERLELQAALRRFGATGPSVVEAARSDDPARLAAAERQRLSDRIDWENRRQTRFSRTRDPRYDINRHIVVTRLKRWLGGKAAWVRPPAEVGAAGMRDQRRGQRRARRPQTVERRRPKTTSDGIAGSG